MSARLIQVEPPAAWELPGGVVTIGRRTTCAVCLDCNSVSREHARLELRGKRWLLTDLGGTNGTFLSGVPISGTVTLHDGDTLRFGHRELRFETGEGPRNEASDITLDGNTLMSRPESRVVTMLVADIEGFTALAAAMASDSLAMAVRSWCQACRHILKENEAILDKFIGDSVFAWWAGNSPEIRNRALTAARAILALESPPDTPPFSSGAALHCARVALCRLPDSTYTLLGSEVNTTFRMEPLTRQLGQPLIVSEAFASEFTPDQVSFVACGSHQLKGLPGPVSVLAATPTVPA